MGKKNMLEVQTQLESSRQQEELSTPMEDT